MNTPRLFVNRKSRHDTIAYWDGGPDNHKAWKKNRRNLGPGWYYYNKGQDVINYVRNESGFRERPLANINWSNSIVLLGCSVVEGIGNTVDDTISKNLENILNVPVLNLGVSGSGIDFAGVNSLILHNDYPTPRAVVQLWSGLGRYSDFVTSSRAIRYMPTKKDYDAKYMWEERNKYYVEADRTLWKNKTIYYEGSVFLDTSQELDITFYEVNDFARDGDHPGPITNRLIAEDIAENLKAQGL